MLLFFDSVLQRSIDRVSCSAVDKLIMFSSLIYQTVCYSLKLYELVILLCSFRSFRRQAAWPLHAIVLSGSGFGADRLPRCSAVLGARDPEGPPPACLTPAVLTAGGNANSAQTTTLVSKLERVWDWEGGLICKGGPNCRNGSSEVQQESGTQ